MTKTAVYAGAFFYGMFRRMWIDYWSSVDPVESYRTWKALRLLRKAGV